MMKRSAVNLNWLCCGALACVALTGCFNDMYDQPRYEPLEASDFFDDGLASRPEVAGTIPRGYLELDTKYFRGKTDGEFVSELPVKLDEALLTRGQERFNIYCSMCHGRVGDGDGMIVRRGYRRPPSFHIERLRGLPVGHYFDVITNGSGAMPSYRHQVPVQDRWAIIAYIRALQVSQFAKVDDLTPEERSKLEKKSSP
jgi:mono/diheme cytochrome c family protein